MTNAQSVHDFIGVDSMAVVERDGEFFINVVDEVTGELVETPIGNVDPRTVLYGIARDIRRRMILVESVRQQQRQEIEHVKAQAGARLAHHAKTIETLEGHAQGLVAMLAQASDAPVDKREFPYYEVAGVGKFYYKKQSVAVNTDGYDGLTDDGKLSIQEDCASLFRINTTVSPNKTAIKAALKEDQKAAPEGQRTVPVGFTLTGGDLAFTFKGE